MVREIAAEARLSFSELDRIVVTTGPGSFTGVRVGLSFARSLALALARPCVGVSTLEALALEEGEAGVRGGAIPAPLGLFAAIYQDGDCIRAPALIPAEDLPALAEAGALWKGPGAGALGGIVASAPNIDALALRGSRLDPACYPPDPAYLRAPDARLPSHPPAAQ
jgi:tRNA threonylcarbamoyladenosine biosynthesis protein TsaB